MTYAILSAVGAAIIWTFVWLIRSYRRTAASNLELAQEVKTLKYENTKLQAQVNQLSNRERGNAASKLQQGEF